MRAVSEVQYARANDGASIAFQISGSGPAFLYSAGFATQVSALWDFPVYFYSQYLERMASFCQVILFDTRGSGMSDPLPSDGYQTLEEQAGDLLAVLDAAGFEQASILAEVNAGPAAIHLAAQHPERVRSLLLNMTYARSLQADDYPGPTPEENDAVMEMIVGAWGTGLTVSLWTPELVDDERLMREMARFERLSASPARMRSLMELWSRNDARADLEHITVPTLVMHDRDNPIIPTEQGRYLAEHIPGAKYIEYPGSTEMSLSENVVLQTEIVCEFLTGNRAHARADRVMQVLLFVDVVASTERALARGDVDWRADVEAFRRAVESHVERFGARLVNTRGDDLFIACPSPTPAVELALEIRDRAAELQLEVRAGLHIAEVEDTGDDFLGMGVHVAARVCEVAAPGEIWVTDALRSAVLGGATRFDDRSEHELKGIPGAWTLSAVLDADDPTHRLIS